ncbi:hypothetical protein COO60DRAFT_1636271 [Scenedesmus sp. NREL 46B-D3]|nr:hypothetical protein COO60DRAFT_1636271 [Scenedesmus sp. NREL 46B-D3]
MRKPVTREAAAAKRVVRAAAAAARRAAARRAASAVEAIELLSDESDHDTKDEEVIELLYSDDYDTIEILDSSEEEDSDDDVQLHFGVSALKRRQPQPHSLQKAQQQHQQQQPAQQPPHTIQMYVDGSYRRKQTAARPYSMAGGVYVSGARFSMARILQGGAPDSCRAELGAIYAAVEHLATAGLAGLLPGMHAHAAAAAAAGSSADAGTGLQDQRQGQQQAAAALLQQAAAEVHILTDCEACLNMLVVRDKVKTKYGALVLAIKRMKAALPFTVRICLVKGHSNEKNAHALGNRRAHRLAYCCSAHEPVCQLPA